MMPLNVAQPGEENIIRKIGGSPEVKQHLADLGFVVGGTVTLLSVLGGNVIVNVKGSRVALNADMARRIMI
jgi:ferrous iron transport protein A